MVFLECIQARNPESFPTKDDNGLSSKASTTRSEINRAAGDFDAFAQLAERFGSFFGPMKRRNLDMDLSNDHISMELPFPNHNFHITSI